MSALGGEVSAPVGVSAPGGGGVCSQEGLLPVGVSAPRGVSALEGGGVASQHAPMRPVTKSKRKCPNWPIESCQS